MPITATVILIGGLIAGESGMGVGFSAAAYIDSQDGEMFNGDVKWYDYLVASFLGGLVGLSLSFTIPMFGFVNMGGALAFGITGSIELSISGIQILTGLGTAGLTLMLASQNRPRNNVDQNKQFKAAARKVGLNQNDPKVKDELRKMHQYIRKNNLDLGWKELVELIRRWFECQYYHIRILSLK